MNTAGPAPIRAGLALALLGAALAAQAQDSFRDAPPLPRTAPPAQPPQPPQRLEPSAPVRPPAPEQAPRGVTSTPDAASASDDLGETQDFGVAATDRLRPTAELHGPTPTAIPGGQVVRTRQLAQWLQGRRGGVLLLHAIASSEHLPDAVPALPAAQGGRFDDRVQREFGQYLEQATGGDRSRPIVTYCAGVQCWGSYNAALRAIHLGYRNVHWYRGGLDAWARAGLPLRGAGEPAPRPR